MRSYIPVIFLLAIVISCNKESGAGGCDIVNGPDALPGSWELRLMRGGLASDAEKEPGNGTVYTFTATTYQHYESHQLKESGSYTIMQTPSPLNGESGHAIIFNNRDTVPYKLGNDTLTLNPAAPIWDGLASFYVRIANAE